MRLGVNIDHVATLRNARGGVHPCPVNAALLAAQAGADGITAHLREDRRHIRDADMERLKKEVALPINFEMAATTEMRDIVLRIKPNAVCLVPEKRTEVTTEGGLDVAGQKARLKDYITPLKNAGIRISLFIDPNLAQVEAAAEVEADIVELHTGSYCEAAHNPEELKKHLSHITLAAAHAKYCGLECHAGHGLSFETVGAIAAIPEIIELNIGHFLIGESIFMGLEHAVQRMKQLMLEARA